MSVIITVFTEAPQWIATHATAVVTVGALLALAGVVAWLRDR